MEEKLKEIDIITVCNKCFRSSCWQGIFMCDKAKTAGTIDLTVKELRLKNTHEHESYWHETKQVTPTSGKE